MCKLQKASYVKSCARGPMAVAWHKASSPIISPAPHAHRFVPFTKRRHIILMPSVAETLLGGYLYENFLNEQGNKVNRGPSCRGISLHQSLVKAPNVSVWPRTQGQILKASIIALAPATPGAQAAHALSWQKHGSSRSCCFKLRDSLLILVAVQRTLGTL